MGLFQVLCVIYQSLEGNGNVSDDAEAPSTDLTEQRFNLFAYMQTFSAICYVLGYPNIWTVWQIWFRMTASLCYFGDTVGRQVG